MTKIHREFHMAFENKFDHMKYTIAVVDDHPLFLEGFKSFLSLNDTIGSIITANDGDQFINQLTDDHNIDIVFMDIIMPIKDGITATRELKKIFPNIKVIALSSLESIDYIEKMIEAGADGYLLKEATPEEINQAIEAVMTGNNYFSSKVIISLSRKTMQSLTSIQQQIKVQLSGREREVLQLLCSGHSRHEIGAQLFISERTVDKHKENILAKTGCRNLVNLVVYSIQNKLVELESLYR